MQHHQTLLQKRTAPVWVQVVIYAGSIALAAVWITAVLRALL